MQAQIHADHSGVYTSGVNLGAHSRYTAQIFRTAVSHYRHLVRTGESLSGSEWAARIAKDPDHVAVVREAARAAVLKVMGE